MKKKTFHRFIAAILEASVLLTAFIPSAAAALLTPSDNALVGKSTDTAATTLPSEGADLITEANTDLSDVEAEAWYFDDVMRLVAKGAVHGYPDGTFRPEGIITYSEFAKILMETIVETHLETPVGIFPNHWASEYMDHAYILGIITDEDIADGFSPDMPITRAKMTKMMILALGIPLAAIENPFMDLDADSDPYALTAYNEYLLRGYTLEDGSRVYRGESNASRAEAATILCRIMDYKNAPYEFKRDAILENAENNILTTDTEIISLFHILNRELIEDFTFKTSIPYEVWAEYYICANVIHLEHFYTTALHCSYVPNSNTYNLHLEYGGSIEKMRQLSAATSARAEEIISAIITEGMSDLDKIKAIHDYLILNCKYDYDGYTEGNIDFESRLAYGALIKGVAICQGYCAAFNLLCKSAGIPTIAVNGTAPANPENHAWNAVLVDGNIFFIDVTHDDPVPDIEGRVNHNYFMLTKEELADLGYRWNSQLVVPKYFF